jgi:putative PIN family toxin of toxin-antitoxin system
VTVVLDSNIFISAFRFRGRPLDIIQMGVEGKLDIAISQSIINETVRVLQVKFGATESELGAALRIMDGCGRMVFPVQKFDVVTDDADDNHIVECAVAAKADTIITGDKDLLRMQSFGNIAIVRLGVFLERYA